MTHPGQLLKQANLYAGKELGQNFLSDPGVSRMIVEKTGINQKSRVLEIGPGLGALTLPIAKATPHVTAVEKDSRLISLLEQELDHEHLDHVVIINKDILKTDIKELAQGEKLVVIGNLPYNISSQIMIHLIENRRHVDRAYLMFQKELAKRIMADPGGREYSRLSAVVQYASQPRHFFDVGPTSFFPRPEVDSTILEFVFFQDLDLDSVQEQMLFKVIKAAFSKRRKTLKNSLSGTDLGLDKTQITSVLESAGVDGQRRAETLTVQEFIAITLAVLALS